MSCATNTAIERPTYLANHACIVHAVCITGEEELELINRQRLKPRTTLLLVIHELPQSAEEPYLQIAVVPEKVDS